jgi:alkylation response protein AidB-like acyl-CoA dehydrogenase
MRAATGAPARPERPLNGLTDEEQQFGAVAYQIAAGYAHHSFGDRAALDAYWDECRQVGMCGLGVPEEYGGAGEDLFPLILATERTSAAGFPATRLVLGQGMCGRILLHAGSDEQRKRWLPAIASGTARFSFGLTEAGSGSNALKMRTTARRTSDGWVLRGEKTFITAFDECNVMMIAANAPDDGGITLFLVEDPQSKIEAQPVTLGMTIYERHWTLYIDDLELGADAVVGEVGKGFRAMFAALNCERLLVGAQSLGLGRYGLGRAVAYASQREVFDTPIGAHQAVQHPLAEAYVQLEAAWALLISAARGYSEGGPGGMLANAAKLACCDAGFFALDRAVQTFGGSGYTADVGLLEPYLVARLLKTVPVSRELALNQIATEGLGLPRSY